MAPPEIRAGPLYESAPLSRSIKPEARIEFLCVVGVRFIGLQMESVLSNLPNAKS
jgi:hypothetical protein